MLALIYRYYLRPLLFRFDAEAMHDRMIRFLQWVGARRGRLFLFKLLFYRNHSTDQNTPAYALAGRLTLKNPVGLAAGFDKNAVAIKALSALGFGFIEVGTVTPQPQLGNVKPRLFRHAEDDAIVNKMGFNNHGMHAIYQRVSAYKATTKPEDRVTIGINIGKNRSTPNASAIDDYAALLKQFRDLADYFVVNVSSPNTPGLRELQTTEFLEQVLEQAQALEILQPLFLKLAPEVFYEDYFKTLLPLFEPKPGSTVPLRRFDGLVLTNTKKTDLGGLSGRPLATTSLLALQKARASLPNITIISVGGIHTPDQLSERLDAGAQAIQVYTGLIYRGPSLVSQLLRAAKSRANRLTKES